MSYFLPDRYIIRTDPIQDFEGEAQRKDDVQKEVYDEAAAIARDMNLHIVIDLGTGSGYKLVTRFGRDCDTCLKDMLVYGVDLAPVVAILRRKYPYHLWGEVESFDAAMMDDDDPPLDLLICSDVIEHVLDPDALCAQIKTLEPEWIVISTPDRDLVDRYFHPTDKTFGPPRNRCHVREWNFEEFDKYMRSHFDVVRHFWSNEKQCTQCVVARLK